MDGFLIVGDVGAAQLFSVVTVEPLHGFTNSFRPPGVALEVVLARLPSGGEGAA